MKTLLVTNDFPPKTGGIQNYLWELWSRLPEPYVYTTPYQGSDAFDKQQHFFIERSTEPFLLPYPWLISRLNKLIMKHKIDLVIIDPAWPLGIIGPLLKSNYGVILHGAEVAIPAKLPLVKRQLKKVLNRASIIIAAGNYPLNSVDHLIVNNTVPTHVIHPGVDTQRFKPLEHSQREALKKRYQIKDNEFVIVAVSRLVPRKGIHNLIEAVEQLDYPIKLLIAGQGRQDKMLNKLIKKTSTKLLGRVSDAELPQLYGCADLVAMTCYDRWFGWEQEGFGIVFLEAAACGVPQLAGRSGGSTEAVLNNETGFVIDEPRDINSISDTIEFCIKNPEILAKMGRSARSHVVNNFDYETLSAKLSQAIA